MITVLINVRVYLVCLLGFFLLHGKTARAENTKPIQLPGLSVKDEHRQVVDVTVPPWRIIGRVQTDLGGKCTGFLISPRIVVTAAHCLWINKTKQYFAPQSVHFLLQYQRQKYKSATLVQTILPAEAYRQLMLNKKEDDIISDRIYLVLAQDVLLTSELVPIATSLPSENTPLTLAGYDQDRIEILYADENCRISEVVHYHNAASKIFHSCQATFGSSGAPLFIKNAKGQWRIVGIQVAAFTDKAGGIAGSLMQEKQ